MDNPSINLSKNQKSRRDEDLIFTELWNHIIYLIQDAFILYHARKYSSSCFMAFTAFEELGKLDILFLKNLLFKGEKEGDSSSHYFSRDHKHKQHQSISYMAVNCHITRKYPEAEKWFTSKFKKAKGKEGASFNLMEFRNNLIYYTEENFPVLKFKNEDAKNMIIMVLEALYQAEGLLDRRYSKTDIILECQEKIRFNTNLFR